MGSRRSGAPRWAWAAVVVSLWPVAGLSQDTDRDRAIAAGPIAVIVHPKNTLKGLTRAELRSIFLRHRSAWTATSDPILLLNWPPLHPVRQRFDQAVLGMSADQAASYWIDWRVRGQGLPPRSTASPVLLVAFVARNQEAIAYLPYSYVTRQVKVLRIDGFVPDHPGYPLRASRRSQ